MLGLLLLYGFSPGGHVQVDYSVTIIVTITLRCATTVGVIPLHIQCDFFFLFDLTLALQQHK